MIAADLNYLCSYLVFFCKDIAHILFLSIVDQVNLLTSISVQLEQGTVTSLLEDNGTVKGIHYKTRTGQELTAYAPLTVVCDGCFSNLRRSLCDPKVRTKEGQPCSLLEMTFRMMMLAILRLEMQSCWKYLNCWCVCLQRVSELASHHVQVDVPSCFVGLVLENCNLPYANHGHVILADPSPILFYPISSTEVRCLVDVPGQKVPSISNGEMANYLKTVVAPQVHLTNYLH